MIPRRPRGAAVLLAAAAAAFLLLFVAAPVGAVFVVALSRGVGPFVRAISRDDTLAAVRLTGLAVGIAVPLNTVFGVTAAWAVTRRARFLGRTALVALIDLPVAVSPVVAGLLLVLVFGARGPLAPWLAEQGLAVVYAPAGVVLATLFVTFPFVARELVPVMEAVGTDEETAAATLGARPWQTFFRITLPNVRWGVVNGVLVCAGRALGEFGAVSVVSGHVRGETATLPLQVELLYNEYDQAGAFSVASLLTGFGLIALVAKRATARRTVGRSAMGGSAS